MKKMLLFLPAAILIAALTVACDDDNCSDYPTEAAMITLRTIDASAPEKAPYYIQFDNGLKGYPSETYVTGYIPDDGKRAIVSYRPIERKPEGYDLGMRIYNIDEVLTKEAIRLTEENAEEVGDDRIDILNAWVSGGYCNILFCFVTNGSQRHLLNLVENTTSAPEAPKEGYIDLEFRQNAYGDTSGYGYRGYVSFRLGDYDPAVTGAKGVRIHYTGLNGKEVTLKLDAE